MNTTNAVEILRDRDQKKTMYTVVMKPVVSERIFYTLDKVKKLCYTKSKLRAWIVFTLKGWKLPKNHSIQIITLRPE